MPNNPELRMEGLRLGRRLRSGLALSGAGLATLVVLVPLAAILGYLAYRGLGALDWAFLTQLPKPVGESGGGMVNAIVGSGLILAIASGLGIPAGVLTGIYLAEFGRSKFSNVVRFLADVLNGIPSIVIGVVVYSLIVIGQRHFSAFSGGVALGIMMIPTISRSTEEMLVMVPHSVREAALGLGIPQWRTTVSVTLRTALPGMITGIMLAFARVAGETAPLLFTAFGNPVLNTDPRQPTAALPLQIFNYAISPFDAWHRQAWAAALLLILLIAGTVMVVRIAAGRGVMPGRN